MPLIFPSNTLSAGGYTVDNSCRFDSGSSAYLSRTLGTPTNNKIWTYSLWVKNCAIGDGNSTLLSTASDASYIYFRPDDADPTPYGFSVESTGNYQFIPLMTFKDPLAYYHICIAVDTTQATEADRTKLYINGSQITSFTSGKETYPSQDLDTSVNSAVAHKIGGFASGTNLDAYLSEVVFIDGTQYAASDFGEFDSDSPTIWKPKDVSDLTFGDNGFYLDFKDSSALGNDVSGNDNDFTESGLAATDQCTDSPTNNFATFNPLFPVSGDTLSEGNVKVQTSDSNYSPSSSSIGVASGKWYAEVKYTAQSSVAALIVGVTSNPSEDARNDDYIGEQSYSYGYNSANGESYTGGSGSSYGDSFAVGDIIGIALNLDDNELIFYKNGTVQNSGTALSITAAASTTSGFYYFAVADTTTNYNITAEINFGNPSFTGTDQDDDNGYGSFEYDPPSGFLALCTKNLGSDGG